MNGSLVVVPVLGLGNRMRIVATSYKLALRTGKKLRIYWSPDKSLNAKWSDLFEIPANLPIIIKDKLPLQYKLLWRLHRHSLTKLVQIYSWLVNMDFAYTDVMAKKVWSGELSLEAEIDKAKNSILYGGQDLNYFSIEDYSKLFVPKADLLQKIHLCTNNFTELTIGIHIRSTDHEWAKKSSPFSVFVKKIEEEIKSQPAMNFFIATDNPLYQDELVEQFGSDKIKFNEKELRRDRREGIRDAVVDMFCLSRTSTIWGSYFSSFSDVAGRIGRKNVEVVKL